MYTPKKEKNPELKAEGSNELDVSYVDVNQEKEKSIIFPILTLIIAIISFSFFPFQVIGVGFGLFTFYMTRKHAKTFLPLTITGLTIAALGLVLGFAGINAMNTFIPAIGELTTGFSCKNLEVQLNGCYDLDLNIINVGVTSNRAVFKVTGQVTSENGDNQLIDVKTDLDPKETKQFTIPYDFESDGMPSNIYLVPILNSYVEKNIFEKCYDYAFNDVFREC